MKVAVNEMHISKTGYVVNDWNSTPLGQRMHIDIQS